MKVKDHSLAQQDLFHVPAIKPLQSKFIASYRVTLVRDQDLPFERCRLSHSGQVQPILKKFIETHGQSDREQFCVLLLNSKNVISGANIVATGTVSSAQVCPREVIKPAILANAVAMIFCHNHPSGDVEPSAEDLSLTEKLIRAAKIIGIQVHEHIIVSMFDDRYYSMADNGIIQRIYERIG